MKNTITNGVVGGGFTGGGIYVSLLPQIEIWLRIGSLAVGLLIGVLTVRNLLRHRK